MWENTKIDLGHIKVGSTNIVKFKYTGDSLPDIHKQPDGSLFIVPSCGACMGKPTWNPNTKELSVKYVPGPVPEHLAKEGRKGYLSHKTVTVHLGDGSKKDILTFTADVHQ